MGHLEDGFSVEIGRRVDAMDLPAWEGLATGRPFSGPRWTRFGEHVMPDCETFHVHLIRDENLAARATFWRVRSEPLPLPPLARAPVAALLRKRPLLTCRAPFVNSSGLILPQDPPLRVAAQKTLLQTGLRLLDETRGSYLLFDFLESTDLDWPAEATVAEVSDPGTRLDIRWDSFEAFLAGADKRGRQHYKRAAREALELGLEHSIHKSVASVDEALPLLRAVEKKFHAAPSPWIRSLLASAPQVGGTWQEVRQRGRLVGCGMLLEDSGVMTATALGLANDVQYAYFLLVYGCLQEAIRRNAKTLRLGSGAYDVKRRLGFELETNNHTAIAATSPALKCIAKWMA